MTMFKFLLVLTLSTLLCLTINAFLPVSRPNKAAFRIAASESSSSRSNIERIEYKIYPDGRVEQKVIGVKGGDCVKLTEEINQALGEVISSEPTEEMFEQKVELDQTLTNTQNNNIGDSWEGASSW